jgi:hypothetical protein
MNTYRVEFTSLSNSRFVVKTTVMELSVDKVESYACQWLSYWMGLNSAEFNITIKA